MELVGVYPCLSALASSGLRGFRGALGRLDLFFGDHIALASVPRSKHHKVRLGSIPFCRTLTYAQRLASDLIAHIAPLFGKSAT